MKARMIIIAAGLAALLNSGCIRDLYQPAKLNSPKKEVCELAKDYRIQEKAVDYKG